MSQKENARPVRLRGLNTNILPPTKPSTGYSKAHSSATLSTTIHRSRSPVATAQRYGRSAGPSPALRSAPSSAVKKSAPAAKPEEDEPKWIHVSVRIRPLSSSESSAGHKCVVTSVEDCVSIEKVERVGAVLQSERGHTQDYAFDATFGPHSATQGIFAETTQPMIESLFEGKNVTVFAYGATGAGKTHTMMGNAADPGIIPLATCELFRQAASFGSTCSIRASFLEVYNETVRDLLGDSDKPLDPCEAADGSIKVLGLTERPVHDAHEVLALIEEGAARRRTEPTAANLVSSRSHAVLQVIVEVTTATRTVAPPPIVPDGTKRPTTRSKSGTTTTTTTVTKTSKFSLIDLAGSERAATTLNRGARLREGANINKSLLALANCINALSSGARAKYRDSKLTHLLKSSLEPGNKCRLAVIACVTPSHRWYEESHNTLKYAFRAKEIKSPFLAGTAGRVGFAVGARRAKPAAPPPPVVTVVEETQEEEEEEEEEFVEEEEEEIQEESRVEEDEPALEASFAEEATPPPRPAPARTRRTSAGAAPTTQATSRSSYGVLAAPGALAEMTMKLQAMAAKLKDVEMERDLLLKRCADSEKRLATLASSLTKERRRVSNGKTKRIVVPMGSKPV